MTGEKLEKILDIDMYLFIEKGLTEGISNITKRYSEANNKYMKNYLDKNNLYDWVMSGYLPYGEFKWLRNVDNFDINSVSENSPRGYILEVHQEYPDGLHVLHNDYPLASGKLAIPFDLLSKYCNKIAYKYGIKAGDVMKLTPNLGEKTNYVLHYRNL